MRVLIMYCLKLGWWVHGARKNRDEKLGEHQLIEYAWGLEGKRAE